MPAVALIVAHMWSRARLAGGIRAAAVVLLITGGVLAAAPFVRARMAPEIASGIRTSALPMGAAALVGGIAAFVAARRRREIAFVALTIPMITIPLFANPLMNSIGIRRSARAFAGELLPHLGPHTEIVGIATYTGSLEFYLGRPVTVVTPDAEEFTSNYIIRHYDRFADGAASPVRLRRR